MPPLIVAHTTYDECQCVRSKAEEERDHYPVDDQDDVKTTIVEQCSEAE